jgi:enamine deaminase RidA (YjgF/YER057c/UK114 family)
VSTFISRAAGLGAPVEPYSYAVRSGDTIHLAGQVALDERGEIVGTTTAEQAPVVWRHIAAVLAAAGSSLADVVKITYYMRDIRELPDEIAVRRTLFPPDRMPAVTAVQAAALGLPGLALEVDVVAVVDRG